MTTRKKKNPDTSEATAQLKVNEEKWSPLLMQAGFTVIPSILLERQNALGLDPLDINIILYLSTYWWTSDGLPHPSKATMAEALGCTPRTIQRRIAAMEASGFVKRIERRESRYGSQTNKYSFEGLIEAAKPFAKEKISERDSKVDARKAAVSRKRPRVTGGKGKTDGSLS